MAVWRLQVAYWHFQVLMLFQLQQKLTLLLLCKLPADSK